MTARFAVRICLHLFASTLFTAGVHGQATRFVGSFNPVSSNTNATIVFTETNDSNLSVTGHFRTKWDYDVTTDGQSITFNTFRVSYDGNIPLGGVPTLVSVDLNFEATVTNFTIDINPVGAMFWDIAPFKFDSQISGTYRSIGYSQTFASPANTNSSDTIEPRLNFSNWPNQLTVEQPTSTADRTMLFTPPAEVLVEPFFKLASITLAHPSSVVLTAVPPALLGCPCCDCGDFDHSTTVDGADFLKWQQGFGTPSAVHGQGDGNGDAAVDGADLTIWHSHFGETLAAASTAVPEPCSAAILATLAIGVSMARRR